MREIGRSVQEWATLYWTSNGAPKEKLIIGLASYARGWKLDNATNDYGIGAFAIGQSDPTDIVRIGGVAAYYEVFYPTLKTMLLLSKQTLIDSIKSN